MDATNTNTALASAMVEELARCGLRHAVVSPGSRSTPLALALWRRPEIDVRVLLDERSAGFVALGAAQAGGVPAAVLCTSGSAAANLHPAVVEADEAGVALVVMTADRPPELRGIGAGQTIDQLKLYGSAVRWFCDVGTHDADDAGLLHHRSVACRAFAAARGEPRPGPVHLNVAWRDPLAPVAVEGAVTARSPLALEGRGDRPLTTVEPATAATLDEERGAALAQRLANCSRGLIVAGRQLDTALAEPVAALARAAGYPILAEPTSQLRLGGHDRGLVVSTYDAIARSAPDELRPELVVRFGDMPTSKALRAWIADATPDQIVVDAHYGFNEPTRRAGLVVRSDPALTAEALAAALGDQGADESWARRWLAADAAVATAIGAELDSLDRPSEPGVHAALGRLYRDGDLVYTASSMPIRDQEAFVASGPADVRFLCNRGANGIDGLVSSGIGAATASRRPTWVVLGDLCLVHDINGLAALRDVETPVRCVAIQNRGGGIFDFLPQAEALERDEFEALLSTPSEVEIERIAALYGIAHRRVESLEELGEASDTPVILEVAVDRGDNVAIHRRLTERATAALATAAAK